MIFLKKLVLGYKRIEVNGMKKITLLILLFITCICCFSGCAENPQPSDYVDENGSIDPYALDNYYEIPSAPSLFYNGVTNIVYDSYKIDGGYLGKITYVYIPYIAPNGLPYKYNPETGNIEMINNTPVVNCSCNENIATKTDAD